MALSRRRLSGVPIVGCYLLDLLRGATSITTQDMAQDNGSFETFHCLEERHSLTSHTSTSKMLTNTGSCRRWSTNSVVRSSLTLLRKSKNSPGNASKKERFKI